MIANCKILNNKRSASSFSVQILSIFTFFRRKRASFSHNPNYKEVIISHFSNSFFIKWQQTNEHKFCYRR